MRDRGFSSEQIAAAIARADDFGYIDDERFALSFVRYRSQRGLGPQRLRADLRERQVDNDLIAAALAQEEIDFFQLCLETRHRKFGEALPQDFKLKAKQQRYLAYRGFSMDMIRYALSPSE